MTNDEFLSAPISTLKCLVAEQDSLDIALTNGTAPSISELADGQRLEGVFCVRERELRQKRNGEPFLRLLLGDSSGSAEAVSWEEAEERFGLAPPGTAVLVGGSFEQSERWGAKIKIRELRPARPDEYDSERLAAGPQVPVER